MSKSERTQKSNKKMEKINLTKISSFCMGENTLKTEDINYKNIFSVYITKAPISLKYKGILYVSKKDHYPNRKGD